MPKQRDEGPRSGRITGIGGVFFRAKHREDLANTGEVTWEFQAASADAKPETRVLAPEEFAVLRAPGAPGFFTVRRGGEILVQGAAQFADMRESDFRGAATFAPRAPAEATALLERNTRPDPFVNLWLALIALCLVGSWWPGRRTP